MAKFKVLHGSHSEGKNEDGTSRIYRRGDIVDSVTDLNKLNYSGSTKFEEIPEIPKNPGTILPPESTKKTVNEQPRLEEQLEKMTVVQLRGYIADHGIEVDPVYSKKSDIIDCILVAMDGV